MECVIYWAILGAYYAFKYYRQLQEREVHLSQLKIQLSESQLRALKMQIHPHFLFNTLNALSTIVMQGKKKPAVSMIAQFGDFLRMTLEDEGKEEILFAKEIEFVQRYLDIEKIRFQDKLNIRIEIHPATLEALVPSLILQPIVENAVRYAIAPRETPGCITFALN